MVVTREAVKLTDLVTILSTVKFFGTLDKNFYLQIKTEKTSYLLNTTLKLQHNIFKLLIDSFVY